MDDLTFSARRNSSDASVKATEPTDADTRFRTLVQSPLRAGILRYLNAHPDEAFHVHALMQVFGRLSWTSTTASTSSRTSAWSD